MSVSRSSKSQSSPFVLLSALNRVSVLVSGISSVHFLCPLFPCIRAIFLRLLSFVAPFIPCLSESCLTFSVRQRWISESEWEGSVDHQ